MYKWEWKNSLYEDHKSSREIKTKIFIIITTQAMAMRTHAELLPHLLGSHKHAPTHVFCLVQSTYSQYVHCSIHLSSTENSCFQIQFQGAQEEIRAGSRSGGVGGGRLMIVKEGGPCAVVEGIRPLSFLCWSGILCVQWKYSFAYRFAQMDNRDICFSFFFFPLQCNCCQENCNLKTSAPRGAIGALTAISYWAYTFIRTNIFTGGWTN